MALPDGVGMGPRRQPARGEEEVGSSSRRRLVPTGTGLVDGLVDGEGAEDGQEDRDDVGSGAGVLVEHGDGGEGLERAGDDGLEVLRVGQDRDDVGQHRPTHGRGDREQVDGLEPVAADDVPGGETGVEDGDQGSRRWPWRRGDAWGSLPVGDDEGERGQE
jgi:hypothetical protein